MNEEIREKSDAIPLKIKSYINQKKPNEQVEIYSGSFTLVTDSFSNEFKGKVFLKWLPSLKVYFETNGITSPTLYEVLTLQVFKGKIEFNSKSFDCHISTFSSTIKGYFVEDVVLGDSNSIVDKISFSLPNFYLDIGYPTREISTNKEVLSRDRISFKDELFEFKLDLISNYKEQNQLLKNDGGYIISHCCEVHKLNRKICYNDFKDIQEKLTCFLSFINGRRTAPLFVRGVINDEVMWEDFRTGIVDEYKFVLRWSAAYNISIYLEALWTNFSERWKDDEAKSALKTAIHWYIEANNNSGMCEGALIMAQTALELLFNWWIVEDKEILQGENAYKLDASNKIRLLLSNINTSAQVPQHFKLMCKYSKQNNDKDAPSIITELRNWVVHEKKKSRDIQSKLDSTIYSEALQMSIWYIELILLKIFNFEGDYFNRCKDGVMVYDSVERVPWSV